MRTSDDLVAFEVLSFLAEMYDEAADFRRYMREKFEKAHLRRAEPTSYVGCRKMRDGTVIVQIWIEAMLEGRDSLTWELDISSLEEGWLVDARVCKVGDNGTATVIQLPDLIAPNFATVRREVPAIFRRLHEAGEEVMEGLSS